MIYECTYVETYGGSPKMAKDLHQSDLIMSKMGEFARVNKIYYKNNRIQTLIRICLMDGKIILCTKQQEFFIKGNWIKAHKLKQGDILGEDATVDICLHSLAEGKFIKLVTDAPSKAYRILPGVITRG